MNGHQGLKPQSPQSQNGFFLEEAPCGRTGFFTPAAEMSTQMRSDAEVLFVLKPEIGSFLFPLFQKGVWVKAETGSSIRSFLCDQLNFPEEYVGKRIQTFFLGGKAVDDIDSALVHDGSVLALSAALPGLLGATLRRGSYYAEMRSTISYKEENQGEISHQGWVGIKLFNLLIPEMAPFLLKGGVWIERKDFHELIEKLPSRFWSGCVESRLNGEKSGQNELLHAVSGERVFVRIEEA